MTRAEQITRLETVRELKLKALRTVRRIHGHRPARHNKTMAFLAAWYQWKAARVNLGYANSKGREFRRHAMNELHAASRLMRDNWAALQAC